MYSRLLHWSLNHRIVVLVTVAALFVAALGLTPFIGREFFPQIDAGQIVMQVRAPSNTRLDATEKRIVDVEKFLESQIPAKERVMIVSEMGLDPDWSAAYTANAGQQDTVIRIQLSDERQAQRPGIRRSSCGTRSRRTASSATCGSASTPAAWYRPP